MIDPSQINTLVQFYGALADGTRLKLIGLLALKPTCGQDLAMQLGVSAPTVSHHISKLKKLDLVSSVREDNTIFYALNTARLQQLTKGIFAEESPSAPRRDERQKVISNFFANGRLKDIPVQRKKKLYVLEEILKAFVAERDYSEAEINDIIKGYFDDYCTIRREFIMNRYMSRDKGVYRLNPPELWIGTDALRSSYAEE
ncbi:MAG: metalloregulator ArsR/SmtB family transcription factor [Peptococcaceae bacterium]|nr:metalloregulator ArsR/SmtB family transcription factor [Peptococcaceae bacterium]